MNNDKEDLDYILILEALKELPFNCGRKLLIDFLRGIEKNSSVSKNKLYKLDSFGSMAYTERELNGLIDKLVLNGMIHLIPMDGNRFAKLLELTSKGNEEISNPSLYKKKLSFNLEESETIITDKDLEFFDEFGEFLSLFNDEQKKAIVCISDRTLCMAGAGSGKTSALIKRIEFLIKYRSVSPEKILAITFTRKARQEMMSRLSKIPETQGVKIETFNSFCEKLLKKHNDLIYEREVSLVSYRDKIKIMQIALEKIGKSFHQAINLYFSSAQRKGRTDDELFRVFLNDCFFVRDYLKFKGRTTQELLIGVDIEHKRSAEMVFEVCNYIESYMKKEGLRDFSDQLIDAISFLEKNEELIPNFEHVLVDEYQDINSTQIKLLKILNSANLFCVGDPRQSIYGWRGSDINYILKFEETYPNAEMIYLTKNYRSTGYIVDLINKSIKNMKLVDLTSEVSGEKDIELKSFVSEDMEFAYIVEKILSSSVPRNEIFVLARTNNKLNELSDKFNSLGISHVVKKEDSIDGDSWEDKITLATVHSIKGLEAEMVFVVGCTTNNFPCKGSEHPVIEIVKVEEYDKEEEEQRLFYVAMSRAKKSLYLTYTGKKPTYFITDEMFKLLGSENINLRIEEAKRELGTQDNSPLKGDMNGDVFDMLKGWRRINSEKESVPAYCVLNDRTLKELAIKMPENLSELKSVNGIGPSKIEKYGEDILKIVNYSC